MNILIQSYNTCFQNTAGGVQVRIKKIHDLLIENGQKVDYFNQFSTRLEDYDVLHVFKLNTENTALIQCAKQKGLRVVISSIVNLVGGAKIDFQRWTNYIGIPSIYRLTQKALVLSDAIVVETPKEGSFVSQHYKIPDNKIKVIPNGIDVDYTVDDSIFETIGKRCDYILQVGLFDENKNQLNVIRAMRDTGVHVVFIGGSSTFIKSNYFEKCKEEANGCDNIHFLGWLDSNSTTLKSAYANAHVLVLPSFNETFGLVAIEGGAAGCHVCMSNTLPILDFDVFEKEKTFDPTSIEEIRSVLTKTMEEPKNDSLRVKCNEVFSWQNVIKKHVEIYQGML